METYTKEEMEKSWLSVEDMQIKQNTAPTGDRREALKIDDKQMVEVDIDFSKPFEKWIDPNNSETIRKIIPVKCSDGTLKNFWLNPHNPIYKEIIQAGLLGQKHFKIMRTGLAKATRYILVK